MANLATINNNILADSGIDPLSLIVGTGTVNYVPKFTAEDTVANSQIFDNGTNVGIGTATPSVKLHVINTAGVAAYFTSSNNSVPVSLFNNGSALATIGFKGTTTSSEFNVRVGADANDFVAYTNNTEQMRITSGGALLVGTTSNPYSLGALVVNHNSSLTRTYFQRGVDLIEIVPSDGTQPNQISSSYTISGSGYKPLSISARQNQADLYLTTGGLVGIGTTSPGSKLQVNSVAGNYGIVNTNGTVSVGTYIEASNSYASFGTSSNHPLGFFTNNNAPQMYITTAGNVGIGTTSPGTRLVVQQSADNAIGFSVTNPTGRASVFGYSSTFQLDIGSSTNDNIRYGNFGAGSGVLSFLNNGSEAMRITSGGDLLVGTTSGTSRIQAVGKANEWVTDLQASTTPGQSYGLVIRAGTSSGDFPFYVLSADNSTAFMAIKGNGNVGIGTTSPSTKLHISNAANGNIALFTNTNDADLFINLSSGVTSLSPSTGILAFGTSSTERMRLDASGNLGLGTSSPAAKLHVAAAAVSGTIDRAVIIANSSASGSGSGSEIYLGWNSPSINAGAGVTIGASYAGGGTNMLFSTPSSIPSAPNVKMTLDGNGNLGLGVTPSAWTSTWRAIQLPGGSIYSNAGGTTGQIAIGQNWYYDGTQNRYINSAAASDYYQYAGEHRWFNAPSGTAGNAISFTQAMTLNASGQLLIGTTSAQSGTRLQVAGFLDVWSSANTLLRLNHDGTRGIIETFTGGGYAPTSINPNGGNVLIGTTTDAGYKLDVSGTARITSNLLAQKVQVGTAATINDAAGVANTLQFANYTLGTFITGSADNYIYKTSNVIGTLSAQTLIFQTRSDVAGGGFAFVSGATPSVIANISSNGAVRFNVYGSGSFTGTRAYDLSVDASGNIIEVPVGAGTITGSGTTNYIPKFTSSSAIGNSIVQDYGDNVWVGTNTAGYGTLNIQRFTSAPYATLTLTDQATPSNPIGLYLRSNGSSPVGISSAGAPIAFYTGGPATNEGMRLDASGNLLIGLSSALANGKLQVAGSIGLSGNTQIRQATNSDGNTLQVFATQVIAGNLNSYSYGYSGGGLLASVSAGDSILLFDAGRTTSTEGRVKIANTTLGNVSFSVEKNGVTTLFASTLGNVGIGSANPQVKLDVQSGSIGAYHNTASSGGAQLYLGDMNFAGGAYATSAPGVGAVYGPTHLVAGDLAFYVYNGVASSRSEAMRIIRHSSGNNYVGIGTTTPTTKLHVLSSDNTYANLVIAATSNNGNVTGGLTFGGLYNSDALNFYTGASSITKMYISNAGNVGIGTTSPGAELVINSANSNTRFFVQNAGSTKIELGHGPTGYGFTHPTGQFLAYADNLYFGQLSGISTNVTFTGGGNVLIGTTSDAGYKLDVNGMGRYSGQLTVDYSSADAVIRLSKGASSIGNIDFVNEGNRFSIQDDGTRRLVIDLSGNVGIGTTSPNGSGWDESSTVLHIYKNTINGGLLKLESSNTTAIFNAGNDQLAIFTTTDDPIRFGTNGSERMRITSGGNVGIGTSSPQAKLDVIGVGVFGTMTSSRSTYSNGLSLQNNTGEATSLFLWQSGVASAHIGSPANSTSLHIVNSYNTGLITDPNSIVLTSTGKVGIGTTSPAYKLEVSLPTTTSDIVQRWTSPSYDSVDLYIGSSQAYFGTLSTTPLAFRTANTERMRITSAGLVGIGTSNPANILSIKNGAAQLDINTTTSTVTLEAIDRGNTGNSVDIGYYARNGSHIFYNGAYAERMRVTSGGQVGINTSSPEQLFTVAGGSISVSGNTGLPRQILELTTASTVSIVRASYQGMGSFGDLALWTGGSERMRITSGGDVGIGTSSPSYKLDVVGVIRSNASNVGTLNLGTDSYSGVYTTAQVIGQTSPSYTSSGKLSFKVLTWGAGSDYGPTEQMYIDVTGPDTKSATLVMLPWGGSVGIGTTTPSSILDARVSSGATSGFRFKGWSDSATPYLLSLGTQTYQDIFQIKSVNGLVTMGIVGAVGATPDLAFQTNSTERMRITSGGNVGIGTSSPSYKLHVVGSIYASNSLTTAGPITVGMTPAPFWNAKFTDYSDGSGVYIGSVQAGGYKYIAGESYYNNSSYWYSDFTTSTVIGLGGGILKFYTDSGLTANTNFIPTERMRITAAGNVGIGTTSPAKALDVYSSANTNTAQIVTSDAGSTNRLYLGTFANNGYITFGGTYQSGWSANGSNAIALINFAAVSGGSIIAFGTSTANGVGPTERMRIDASGNVGIGTSSPDQIGYGAGTIIGILSPAADATNLQLGVVGSSGATSGSLADINFFGKNATASVVNRALIRAGIDGATNSNFFSFWTMKAGSLTEKMRLDASGNLGLGVTPSAWGSNAKALQFSGGSLWNFTSSYLFLSQNAYFDNTNQIYVNSAPASDYYQYNGQHIWRNAPSGTAGTAISFTQAMTLDASGRLGIGTTSPTYKLHINTSNNNDGIAIYYPATSLQFPFYVGDNSNGTYAQLSAYDFEFKRNGGASTIKTVGSSNNLILQSANDLVFNTNGANERMRITSGGDVGIGTTADLARTTILSDANAQTIGLIGRSGDNISTIRWWNNAGNTVYTAIESNANYTIYNTVTNGYAAFFTNNTERMRITSGGNVLVGTTTDAGYKFDVAGSLRNTTSAYFATSSGSVGIGTTSPDASTKLQVESSSSSSLRVVSSAASGGDLYLTSVNGGSESRIDKQGTAGPLTFYNNGSERMRITSSGNTELSGSIKTGTPSGGTAVPWKLGSRITNSCGLPGTYADFASSFMVSNKVIEVEIDGVLVYIPIVNPGWC